MYLSSTYNRFLRTYGGYSTDVEVMKLLDGYSPYTRGLFVMDVLNAEFNPFSPYPRRLFYCRCSFNCTGIVFFVHTRGLFWRVFQNPKTQSFPRTHGGYSKHTKSTRRLDTFSLYLRGLFSFRRLIRVGHFFPRKRGLFVTSHFRSL